MDATLSQILSALYTSDKQLNELKQELSIVKEALTKLFNEKTDLEKRLHELVTGQEV